MLLSMLADNDPKNQSTHESGPKLDLAEEILMLLSSRPRDYHVNDLPEVCRSVINYGISDIFPDGLSKTERVAIMQARLLKTLRLFEPRFKNISVTQGDENQGCSVFIITAEMNGDGVYLPLEWDELLGNFSIRA